MIRELTFDKV